MRLSIILRDDASWLHGVNYGSSRDIAARVEEAALHIEAIEARVADLEAGRDALRAERDKFLEALELVAKASFLDLPLAPERSAAAIARRTLKWARRFNELESGRRSDGGP